MSEIERAPARAADIEPALRRRILEAPEVILDDQDVMAALMRAVSGNSPANVVDLRGVALERLETRFTRLKETHRSVIAAAYENVSGTHQVHRAVLALLEAPDFEAFLVALGHEVTDVLRVSATRLVLETRQESARTLLSRFHDIVTVAEPGFVADYVGQGRPGAQRKVTLRPLPGGRPSLYGDRAGWVGSEACITLDFGRDRFPGLLAFASDDPGHFRASQGTDLLAFLGRVFETSMQRWIA